ncbi:MAG: fatty acid oxidation complex subunit alpha FadB [Alteromonadaceae bacterium TMED7]|uniref:enoyl-CoA hydratase n=1 Tax=Alteromonas alba TaxID=2079529 RepID=A0A2S9V7G2_9ALTE|nr:fatty acid oxidation complex subunit alpha FadB [Alteromonas alba]MAJ70738.1 fatty acid oxidation complex subunit alpha FadB [Alteromonadaceae bacterium]MCP4862862.1 fatty acid oxidation complex subunit alpha FadB [Alteromonas sp.]PRO72265.1 fatty acid oxidation complex subunit alpha FadB [Alteromonas alba]RPH19392.1 MAG: fatty acid oxidation complex subunit alpha FadB [Alteromonadaceae bacterium TMED7]|tara:strand:+ start:12440 stop:14590 length:2151 start_codon:yes stop_codon:yes gene_type:complete
MIYEGQNLTVSLLDNGFAELVFDAKGSVNKFDRQTISDLDEATQAIAANSDVKGVVVRSAKPAFIVGADITEFTDMFAQPEEEILAWVAKTSKVFDRFEDLPVPTVAAVNGFALGGGCEMALACDLRVVDTTASIGLPEVKLGLMPGFGGTVRLPRLIGSDNALEWMTTGKDRKGQQALNEGAVDAVVAPEKLAEAALSMVTDAAAGKIDWQARRASKKAPLKLNSNEAMMSFSTAQAFVAAKAGKHYPAPHMMVETVKNASSLDRDGALALENQGFVKLAKTDAAKAQIGIFMADQLVKGKGKKLAKSASKAVKMNAVLGAGIMGGGIAYQSAVKGLPVVMKDINQPALDLGLSEAAKILNKGMQLGKVTPEKMAKTLNAITPSLEYSAIKDVDLVIEAVVENPKVKSIVLKETEQNVDDDTILCSNTSTISINQLAESLEKPERFCGMHFFNPVHRMPLVEIIRGEKTSDDTIAAVVATTLQMGKTPIVVNDCPGFLVNRVLFPYFAGFSKLVLDGADFVAVDKVMEKQFGWPMGPAYLLDVVGMDTADHAASVMAEGIPERMAKVENDPVTLLFKEERLGQKNAKGFYNFSKDKRGKPKKDAAPEAYELIKPHQAEASEFSSEEIIARLMIPMANEAIRCLEEGIVASAAEADMALIYGLGFPPFRGGIFRYIETMGLANFVELADKYAHLGPIYQITDGVRQMAAEGKSYFA